MLYTSIMENKKSVVDKCMKISSLWKVSKGIAFHWNVTRMGRKPTIDIQMLIFLLANSR